MTTFYPIDPDALKAVYEQAKANHPDASKGWGKAILAGYEYLMDLWADERPIVFDGQVMLVESATEPGTIHRSNGGCDCHAGLRAAERAQEAAEHGEPAPAPALCWHRAARQLAARMLARVAYLAEADQVAAAIDHLHHNNADCFELADVQAQRAALQARIAKARRLMESIERKPTRSARYAEAEAALMECF